MITSTPDNLIKNCTSNFRNPVPDVVRDAQTYDVYKMTRSVIIFCYLHLLSDFPLVRRVSGKEIARLSSEVGA